MPLIFQLIDTTIWPTYLVDLFGRSKRHQIRSPGDEKPNSRADCFTKLLRSKIAANTPLLHFKLYCSASPSCSASHSYQVALLAHRHTACSSLTNHSCCLRSAAWGWMAVHRMDRPLKTITKATINTPT